MASMKRPAAMKKPAGQPPQKKAKEANDIKEMTNDRFSLPDFCEQLLASLQLRRSGKPLHFATAFSGSGAPSLVLSCLLEDGVVELFSSEKELSACHALMRNTKTRHIYEDAMAAAQKKKPAWCCQHGRLCDIPAGKQDLYIAGFTCKGNSTQNPNRFTESPAESKHFEAFEACILHIKNHKPVSFILENVTGVLMKESSDSEKKFIEVLMGKMKEEIPEYEVGYVKITAAPLPTSRPRIYWIGHTNASVKEVVVQIEKLISTVSGWKVHHVDSFLDAADDPSIAKWAILGSSMKSAHEIDEAASYASALAKARDKAGKRLPQALSWPAVPDRESRHCTEVLPWLKAQVDCYEQICSFMSIARSNEHWLADVSQTSNRGSVKLTGTVPTLTTSSRLWSYKLHRELTPDECMRIHGFSQYDLRGLSTSEAKAIIGNMMAGTALAIILCPVLRSLGCLVPS